MKSHPGNMENFQPTYCPSSHQAIYLPPFALPPTFPSTSLLFLCVSFPPFSLASIPSASEQGQLKHLGLGFTCDLALKFSFEDFDFPQLQDLEEGRAFRSVERGGVGQELVEARTSKVSFLSISFIFESSFRHCLFFFLVVPIIVQRGGG